MKKILVIDDEPELLELVKMRLQANDYEVITAADGQEGIDIARVGQPDLILLDIMMPNIDGAEAYSILQNDPDTESIPVIFLTALVTKDEEEKLKAHVGEEYLMIVAKPFNADEMLAKIKEVLGEI